MTPARTAPQYVHGPPVRGSTTPRETLQPANGRISSDGIGIAALSMAIAITTPTYPKRPYNESMKGRTNWSTASIKSPYRSQGVSDTSALAADMREALRTQRRADLVVGIPSFRNAATIGHVTEAASEGLRRNFPEMRAVIVNADGGSEDGTPDRVRASADGIPTIAGRYQGKSGKGSAFRAIFEAVTLLDAKACAVVDSDLRSITPEWIARLIGPMFTQVVGTLLTLARKYADIWRPVTGSRDVPVIGEIAPVEPEAVNASVRVLVEKFKAGAVEQDKAWDEILSADTRDVARKAAETGHASANRGRFVAQAG